MFRGGKRIALLENDNRTCIFLDTNVLLNNIKDQWHIESMNQKVTTEFYKLIVPKFIIEELKQVQEKRTIKNGALRFAEELTQIVDDSQYLQPEDYNKPIDDLLLHFVQQLPCKKYIMTQDMGLKNKIVLAGIPVIFISYGKAKILRE